MKRAAFLLVSLTAALAAAQPAPAPAPAPPASTDKLDAKALMASGLKLYAAKDYLGALAVFQQAYARFPTAKILLNVATTLKQLNRNAEAANAYQRYLDAKDTDPAKRAEVEKVLAGLDATVGTLTLTVAPATAELQVDSGDWQPAAEVHALRVPAGTVHVRARATGYQPVDKAIDIKAGATEPVMLALPAIPAPPTTQTDLHAQALSATASTTPSTTTAAPASKLGAAIDAHVDVTHKGGAAIVGITYEPVAHLSVEAGALIGPASGAYAGARYSFLPGRLRPLVAAGMPVFISSGARVGIRGAAGIEYLLSPHLSAIAEAGIEHVFNPEMNVIATMFVPSVGVAGRL